MTNCRIEEEGEGQRGLEGETTEREEETHLFGGEREEISNGEDRRETASESLDLSLSSLGESHVDHYEEGKDMVSIVREAT